jgi:uncharacterized membrane protein
VERTDLSRLLAFALIGRFWLVHHRMFEAVRALPVAFLSTTAAALLWLSTLALRSPLGWLGATAR